MPTIPNQLPPLLAHVPAWIPLLGLLAVSLALIFAGKTVVKIAAFLIVGLAGAAIGETLGAQFLPPSGDLVGLIVGFVLGGLLGIMLITVGIGLAVGYSAYLLALSLALGSTAAFVIGVIFFAVGIVLSGRILTLVTALAGGFLLFDVLRLYHLGLMLSSLLAVLITIAGLWVQYSPGRRFTQPTASRAGGQPSDSR